MTPQEFKEIRLSAGLTQAMLAKKLYLLPRQIQRYEAGNLEIPRLISEYMNIFFRKREKLNKTSPEKT